MLDIFDMSSGSVQYGMKYFMKVNTDPIDATILVEQGDTEIEPINGVYLVDTKTYTVTCNQRRNSRWCGRGNNVSAIFSSYAKHFTVPFLTAYGDYRLISRFAICQSNDSINHFKKNRLV